MTIAAISIVAGLLGVMLLAVSLGYLRKGRPLTAGSQAMAGLLLFAIGMLLATLAFNLRTYARFTYEQPVAELSFRVVAPRHYHVTLRHNDGREQAFELRGDEWQLDARMLKWRGVAVLLGLDAQYRLERLAGRYRAVEDERSAVRTVYDLAPARGIDVWALAQRYRRWFGWVDAIQGSGAYLPMADRARYRVTLTQTGLLARPLNDAAQEAIEDWR